MKIKQNTNCLLPLLVILISISSCSNNASSKARPIEAKVLFQKTPMDTIYNSLRPALETFNINSAETQEIVSKSGTEVLIPANSFVDASGKVVSGSVAIEMVEANKLSDFVTCDLETLSDGNMLQSAGMLFIDAKSDGQALRIADGQSISISMPMMKRGSGYQMFTGEYGEDGSMNWELEESAEKNYLIPFPAEVIYDDYWLGWGERSRGDWFIGIDSARYDPRQEQFSNTFIQTREFRFRLWRLYEASYVISTLLNKDIDPYKYENIKIDDQLFELYYTNLDMDIEILDSMANSVVDEYLGSFEVQEWMKAEKAREKTGDYSYSWVDHYDKEKFQRLLDLSGDGAKGNVPKFDTKGIDPLSENAFEVLLSKGFTNKEALTIINIAKERKAYIDETARIKAARARKEKMQKFVQEVVFPTSKLGWINCDRFLNDPNADKAEILVSIDSDVDLEYTDCSLVIPSMNARLSAFPGENNSYTFTKKDGIYTKLPIGREAYIIGVSIVEGECHFSSEKIRIAKELSVTLKMKQIEKEDLKTELDQIL